MTKEPTSILKLGRISLGLDYREAFETVKRASGMGALRQSFEILRHSLGRGRFSPSEYYLEGLWRPELSAEERASFISEHASTKLNRQLSPLDESSLNGLLTDKLLTGLVLRSAGFPALAPRAVFGKLVRVPGVKRLSSAREIAEFLGQEDNLPVFGKPLHASLSIGAGSFVSLADSGQSLVLGNGRVVGLKALAEEIASNFPRGYVFEPLIRQHPEVERVTGLAVGGLRVLTLRNPDDVEVLYTVQRLPAVGAMMDASHLGNPYSTALIDHETGRVLRAQAMNSMAAESLETSPVTGVRFDSVVLPFMKEAHDLALDVHRMLARPGVLGFDMALTAKGPLITEINGNPFHTTYQRAANRGLLNPEFRPRIETALAVVRSESGKGWRIRTNPALENRPNRR